MNEWMNASINNVNIINQSISQWVGEWVSLQAFGKRMNTLIEWNSKRLNECEMIILQGDYCNRGHQGSHKCNVTYPHTAGCGPRLIFEDEFYQLEV